uniref:Translin-associated protein X n=1 Tax=Lygus hesperus TaxID=30085 RepID=A0A0A9YRR3_LYGHE
MAAMEESPIITAFRKYSEDLSKKHDKHERIVKISRDITIESKRLIFTIHSLSTDKKADTEIEKIRDRFKKLMESHFRKIAIELENEDPYLYHRAYTWGVQEYIEALTYFNYVTTGELVGWEKVAENCSFDFRSKVDSDTMEDEIKQIRLLIPLSDYILGIQDMTGEMMRLCITSLGKGNIQKAQAACNFVKYVYAALHILQSCHNEFYKKLEVAEQSLRKMEYGCYLATIQGLEMKTQ